MDLLIFLEKSEEENVSEYFCGLQNAESIKYIKIMIIICGNNCLTKVFREFRFSFN